MSRAACLVALAGCASSPAVPVARFANAPAVLVVNDRENVPAPPKERVYATYLDNFDGSFHRIVTRPLKLERDARARGVNALDEVPDSTWFTNRIGVRDVSPDDVASPPGSVGTPELFKPWKVVSTKVSGPWIGVVIVDTRGEKFVLRFDPRGFPEAATATQVIVGRLLWALGYNVTDDYVVRLRRDDLVIAPGTKLKDASGRFVPLDKKQLDARLADVDIGSDGTLRALASRYLDGTPLGGHPGVGVRRDDPNDVIPHELRRDLRGTASIFAWLDHTDLHVGNSLDVWVTDSAEPSRHYVKHYFVDFGIGLGFGATKNHNPRVGYEYQFDWRAMARSLLSLGLIQRPWETREKPPYRGVGLYDVSNYDPGAWKPLTPVYTPVRVADRIDKFWGAKLIMKLDRDHIRAAVESARLSDPRATEWLVNALVERQRRTAKYWFTRVNPIDALDVVDGKLCFKDLAIAHAFAAARNTRYTLTYYDTNGARIGATEVAATASGVTCGPLVLSAGHDRYTIVRVDTARPGFSGTTYVHVASEPITLTARVIGIWRA
jgi:hypothetical protein